MTQYNLALNSHNIALRDYQQRTIDQTISWLENNPGNPIAVLPTGAGKSHVVAGFTKMAVTNWPGTRCMMVTHKKELIEQNAEKMLQHWPNAPMGIFSASVGRKQIGEPITFAGIQSIGKLAHKFGPQDLMFIDECHMVNHKAEGLYRSFIETLLDMNNDMRVIGLTAYPYRLGHGLLTDKPGIWDGLLEPVTIKELIVRGFLARIVSKRTDFTQNVTGVHTRGGDYIETELQLAVDIPEDNIRIVQEILARVASIEESRQPLKAWLVFCAGVEHAQHIATLLNAYGIPTGCIHGGLTKAQREYLIGEFKAGRLRCLTNCEVLTTGFDHPEIDLIVMLCPTKSVVKYGQMVGRAMRLKHDGRDGWVFDFAGVVNMHGPITAIKAPTRAGLGTGEAPVKSCPDCGELVAISSAKCEDCGYEFPPPEPKKIYLRNDDVLGIDPQEMQVTAWQWSVQTSRSSGNKMIRVRYYGCLDEKPHDEYLVVSDAGYPGHKARETLRHMIDKCGVQLDAHAMMEIICETMGYTEPPMLIKFVREGKYHRIIERGWNDEAMSEEC